MSDVKIVLLVGMIDGCQWVLMVVGGGGMENEKKTKLTKGVIRSDCKRWRCRTTEQFDVDDTTELGWEFGLIG